MKLDSHALQMSPSMPILVVREVLILTVKTCTSSLENFWDSLNRICTPNPYHPQSYRHNAYEYCMLCVPKECGSSRSYPRGEHDFNTRTDSTGFGWTSTEPIESNHIQSPKRKCQIQIFCITHTKMPPSLTPSLSPSLSLSPLNLSISSLSFLLPPPSLPCM